MKVLIAEDDPLFRKILRQMLSPDFEVTMAQDGTAAWAILQRFDSPVIAILDWVMPGMTGPQVCREARGNPRTASDYLILLTARNSGSDIVAGLRSGADDYITKPFEAESLRARVRMGQRILELQSRLLVQGRALENALTREATPQTRIEPPSGHHAALIGATDFSPSNHPAKPEGSTAKPHASPQLSHR